MGDIEEAPSLQSGATRGVSCSLEGLTSQLFLEQGPHFRERLVQRGQAVHLGIKERAGEEMKPEKS